jgi:Tfp pilus assembly protein PilF
VIAADDAYSGGHAGLSLVNSLRVSQGFIRPGFNLDQAVRKSDELARAALKRDPNSTLAMFAMAHSALPNHNPDEAVDQATKAYFSQPGDAYYAATLGYMLTFAGKPREAYYPLERAIERERVSEFQARAYFFKLFAAYEAGDYAMADQAYADHIRVQGRCFSNCLAYAAASKLRLAELAEVAQQTDQKQRFETEARILATNLSTTYPDYLSRVNAWLAFYKNEADAQRFRRDLDRVYALLK